MNNRDFQNICSNLLEKYASKRLSDADVDVFADVVSNVLEREDLRAEGTAYAELSERISHDYEHDVNMTPLLARTYELCRMYERYRKRPLTEMEKAGRLAEERRPPSQRKSALLVFRNGNEPVASCWWEDLHDCAGIAEKVADVVAAIPEGCVGTAGICRVLLEQGCGFDPLDMASISAARELGLEVVEATSRDMGIIAIGGGMEQNRARRGSEVKVSLDKRSVYMDAYLVYGLDFYRELTGDTEFSTEGLEELRGSDVGYSFSDARKAADDWKGRLGEVFAMPGSPNLVGVKRAVVKEREREVA